MDYVSFPLLDDLYLIPHVREPTPEGSLFGLPVMGENQDFFSPELVHPTSHNERMGGVIYPVIEPINSHPDGMPGQSTQDKPSKRRKPAKQRAGQDGAAPDRTASKPTRVQPYRKAKQAKQPVSR